MLWLPVRSRSWNEPISPLGWVLVPARPRQWGVGIVGRICSARTSLLVVAFTGISCGLVPDSAPARDESGAHVESGTLAAFDLQLGDCFNDPGSGEVESVIVVPCAESHDFEVYHVFTMDDGPYPGTDVIQAEWIDGCLGEFEPFVGISFDSSILDISAIFPTQQSWEELGDRVILCSVTAVDGAPRTGSARGSNV